MSQQLPDPPVSADTDVRNLDGFMLNVERMLASELWALSTPEEFKAAFALWMRAWKQMPGGSLPDDDKVLAVFSGTGKGWRKVKDMALRGFIKCSDGRLYHKVLCEDVKRAAQKRTERAERTRAATEARRRDRNDRRDEQRNVHRDVLHGDGDNDIRDVERDDQRNVVPGTGQGQDRTGTKKENKKENKQDSAADAAGVSDVANGSERYAFEAGVIRLSAKHLEQWKKAYPNVSLEAELFGLQDWAQRQPNWFVAVSSALAKKQREAVLAVEKIRLELEKKGATQTSTPIEYDRGI